MALQKNTISASGIEVENAYYKIDEYTCDKNDIAQATIRAYVNKELNENGAAPIEGTTHYISCLIDYSDEAVNTKKQIYEHVKRQNNFVDAIDC